MSNPCVHVIGRHRDGYRLTDYSPGKHLPLSSRYETLSLEEMLERYRTLACNQELHVECWDLKDLPPIIPDCKHLVIQPVYDAACGVWDFPDVLLRIPSLQSLRMLRFAIFRRIPPSFRVKSLHVNCQEAPYWLLETTDLQNTLVRGSYNWLYRLQDLRRLILQGLQTEGRWKQWLTKGLYDPRLFVLIRDCLL